MSRVHDWDDDSITVGIIPQACGNCGGRTDRVRMSLDVVVSGTSDFVGIRTMAQTPCCGGRRTAAYPADKLAKLLDHFQHCTEHQKKP